MPSREINEGCLASSWYIKVAYKSKLVDAYRHVHTHAYGMAAFSERYSIDCSVSTLCVSKPIGIIV